jgi:GntR family transcriptional regulator, transcriptional repressor for pyruvate dehydrogenase complex
MASDDARVRPTDENTLAEPRQWARPEKLAQTLAAHIRRQFMTGEMADGYLFPSEPILVEQYKVSRTTLREAFRILEAQSLVQIQRGAKGGARATVPDIAVAAHQLGMHLQLQGATLRSVYQTRTTLEVPMAKELAVQRDPEKIKLLRRALADEQRSLGNSDEFRDASMHFHELIGQLSGNATAQVVANVLGQLVNLHAQQVVHESVPNEEAAVHRAHTKLLRLVEKGDAADAEAHWRAHLDAVSGRMTGHPESSEVINLFH